MFAIANTEIKWAEFLMEKGITGEVNFWTPTDWKIRGLKRGDRLYFMLKSPIRQIGGYGSFVDYKIMDVDAAWNEFGIRNGCDSILELKSRLAAYNSNVTLSAIGCLILNDICFFDSPVDPANVGLSFPREVVKFKYYRDTTDPFLSHEAISYTTPFALVHSTDKTKKNHLMSERVGQPQFKLDISNAYGYKCCISGEVTPELLQAAHIQSYINKDSNHPQNGLLLRIDLHKMYDSGLLTIDEDYKVHISRKVTSPDYTMFDGKTIALPKNKSKWPSSIAIKEKMKEFRP